MLVLSRRRRIGYALAFVLPLAALVGSTRGAAASARSTAGDSVSSTVHFATTTDVIRFVDDSLRGRSGKLFVRFLAADVRTKALPAFRQLFGDTALARPGVYPVTDSNLSLPFAFIALHAFGEKQSGQLGGYRIGFWPGERGAVAAAYGNPAGFIEVTRENADLHVSEHFRLRDFLTHDQANVWPKYLVLREDLVDKLELVVQELERSGVPVRHMSVMSGFRTPQYNATGGITSGRAQLSRHMYGDASDVFVDNDYDGRMDDLNHDGRVDYRDAQVVVAASERVERAHPELLGGGGIYKATREHGPFAHIDVRGNRARWGLTE
ncbi:MAG: hypothetical protein JWM41_4456 [Gemmatimonadetes bacterium]|nr:hypothetical protein [Gemmatimonadota bacterium]